jgi:hypothetical protein
MNYSPLTQLISAFTTRSGAHVRKEYLRCQLLRHLKKLIRTILKGLSLISLFSDPQKLATMQAMERVVMGNQELFSSLSQTKIEGNSRQKSFNDAYCKGILASKEMRMCYELYVELMFGEGEVNPAELCTRLKQYCCREARHGEECRERWRGLREYVREGMVRELGLYGED